ncbi:chemotaxis protein CheD [bacterium]|nr:chemotaxis protein CheD [bacterium]
MLTTENNDERVWLLPGQLIVSKKSKIIWTLLGSCVSIIFYNRRTQLSAVCHAQLPGKAEKFSCKESCPNPCGMHSQEEDFKYVACSFKHMLSLFQKSGIQKTEIEVSLYGGAKMLDFGTETISIGTKNIEKAKDLIRKNNMRIINENVGGNQSRTIIYFPKTGKIELKINSFPK